jgi:hypothetical protein
MNATDIDRRQFLRSSLMATALAAAGHLPLLATETDSGSGIDPEPGGYPIKVIRGHLKQFTPVTDTQDNANHLHLAYDIIYWVGGNRLTGQCKNTVIGRVEIDRLKMGDGLKYRVTQRTKIGTIDNFLEARLTCAPDAGNTVQSWQLHGYHKNANDEFIPTSQIAEVGSLKGGRIHIDGRSYKYDYTPTHPVLTQWTIPDLLLQTASPSLDITFDLLQDLSIYKPDQSLIYDGQTEVPIADGRRVTLSTYAQTGYGLLPTHYLLDNKNRPQLITTSILSWALTEFSSNT